MSPAAEFHRAELAARIRQGDPRADAELVERYGRAVRVILKQLLRGRPEAEDLFQDTFRLALEKIRRGELRDPATLPRFVTSLARNLAIDLFRVETRRRTDADDEAVASAAGPRAPAPADEPPRGRGHRLPGASRRGTRRPGLRRRARAGAERPAGGLPRRPLRHPRRDRRRYPALSGLALSLFDPAGRPRDGFLRLRDIFMTRFYRAMVEGGLPPAAALRQSQLSMLGERRWSDPRDWAGCKSVPYPTL